MPIPTPTPVHEDSVLVDGVRIHLRRAGEGPLVLLLHGWPETGHCWRHVLPELARRYTVVAPDLRGYGQSGRPQDGYDKRTMARDMSLLMHRLGFDEAAVVGHDRGARVAHRWALDRPGEIRRLALLSIIPTREMWRRMDARTAATYWHWLFHLVPDLPEFLTEGKAAEYVRFMLDRGVVQRHALRPADIEHYAESYSRPGAMRAGFDDYRAAFTTDMTADDADAEAGRRLTMPTLVLWGAGGLAGTLPVLDIWRTYAEEVTGEAITDCGHFPMEEQPDQVLTRLEAFLGD